jgi:hypothetical protein
MQARDRQRFMMFAVNGPPGLVQRSQGRLSFLPCCSSHLKRISIIQATIRQDATIRSKAPAKSCSACTQDRGAAGAGTTGSRASIRWSNQQPTRQSANLPIEASLCFLSAFSILLQERQRSAARVPCTARSQANKEIRSATQAERDIADPIFCLLSNRRTGILLKGQERSAAPCSDGFVSSVY